MSEVSRFKNNTFFKAHEFDSPDMRGSGEFMDVEFIQMLTHARILAQLPFVIKSGFRTVSHNKDVGGKKDSSHLSGIACDIYCYTSGARYTILGALLKAGFRRIGIGRTFIHVDTDVTKVNNLVWHYY